MTYTAEQLIDRYETVKELNSIACEHCLYFGRRQQDLELERLWCKSAPDPHFAQNNGFFEGYEALDSLYAHAEAQRKADYDERLKVLEPEFADCADDLRYGTLTMSLQPLSTPCIEIAEDYRTAKGLWTITGQVTALDDSGPVGLWAYGKMGIDFVLEDSEWKIWHMMVCTDFVSPAGEKFDPELGERLYPAGLGIDEVPTRPAEVYSMYSNLRPASNVPGIPEPYSTFAETFSY